MKRLSRTAVERGRGDACRALADAACRRRCVNGGGTGSAAWAAADPALTGITAGSGFVAPHLFDGYRGLALEPAAVLRASRSCAGPRRVVVTFHGGGYVASGEAGVDRLPVPALPAGVRLLPLEGAGGVQTPARGARGGRARARRIPCCSVTRRPASSPSTSNRYLLVRGDQVIEEAPTWRGLASVFSASAAPARARGLASSRPRPSSG